MEKSITASGPVSHRLGNVAPNVVYRPDVASGVAHGRHRARREGYTGIQKASFAALVGLGVLAGTGAIDHINHDSRVSYSTTADGFGPRKANAGDLGGIEFAKVEKALDPARSENKLNQFNFMEKLSDHADPKLDKLFPGSNFWIESIQNNPGELAAVVANVNGIDLHGKAVKPAKDDMDAINALSDKFVADGDLHTQVAEQVEAKFNDTNKTEKVDEGYVTAGEDEYNTLQVTPVDKNSDQYGKIQRTTVSESGQWFDINLDDNKVTIFNNCGQFGDNIRKISKPAPVQEVVQQRVVQNQPQYLVQQSKPQPQVHVEVEEAPAAPEVVITPPPAAAPPPTIRFEIPNLPAIEIPQIQIPQIQIPQIQIPQLPTIDLTPKNPGQDIWANPQVPVPQQRGGVIMPSGPSQPENTVVTPPQHYNPPAAAAPNNNPAPNSAPSGVWNHGQQQQGGLSTGNGNGGHGGGVTHGNVGE